ncbi:MAG: hypothetical protein RL038_557 [Actinomycetota bacterium]
MQHQIKRLSGVFAFALVALMANLLSSQVFQVEELRSRPDNTRLILEEYGRERGAIVVDGKFIAKSVATDGTLIYERRYPFGSTYSNATGYYSIVYGTTAIERIYGSVLSGQDDRLAIDRLQQLLSGTEVRGGVVTLTLDHEMQTAAASALGNRAGAVVAIDVETGEILTLVGAPTFDPNRLVANDTNKVQRYYEKLLQNPNKPLLNRPLVQTLPPGSTFKVVVAAAALESGLFTAASEIPGPAKIQLPLSDKKLGNWQNAACESDNTVTLLKALEVSCNTAFAWLGMELGSDAIQAQAEAFGFNQSFDTPLTAATSVFPTGLDAAQTAMSAIGQFDVRATALQMAMVNAAILNDGKLMQPQLVRDIRTADLQILEKSEPRLIRQAISNSTAAALKEMMRSVVVNGTASSLDLPGIWVGGKTGTAETGTDALPHAWMSAIMEANGRKIAIAVVVENGGGALEVSGNQIAGPIAAKVIAAAIQ